MSKYELNAYINFAGNAKEALEFYKSVFGGELELSPFGEMVPSQAEQIMHGVLKNEYFTLMASDTNMPESYKTGTNFNLSVIGEDEEELTSFFKSLSEGGKVTMPLSKQMWGDTFGMFTDKFGIDWMINIVMPKA